MYCTTCGTEARETDKFCCQCGVLTGQAPRASRADRLSRPMLEAKVAGVCAGFARYFGVDVTLLRILWIVFTVWPLPFFGVISYVVAWIVMPKDPVTSMQQVRVTQV
jgi:phage shock protein C